MFDKTKKIELVALHYKVALKDLEQGHEAGFIRPIAFNMAMFRLNQSTLNTIYGIGGSEGYKLFQKIINENE